MKRNERYKIVPTELVANLRFRRDLLTRCQADKAFRDAVWKVCKEDCLFFFNCMCWVYEPRPRIVNGIVLPHQMPFIAWEHQVPAILTIKEHLGLSDIGCLAGDSLVVTDRGAVPIRDVQRSDLLWDGVDFVSHGGVVFQGVKKTISAYGIRLTPDHQVLTERGWQNAERRIDRQTVRLPYGYRSSRWIQDTVQVRLRRRKSFSFKRRNKNHWQRRKSVVLSQMSIANTIYRDTRNGTLKTLQRVGGYGRSLHKNDTSRLEGLRRTRHNRCGEMEGLRSILEGHGAIIHGRDDDRSSQQQFGLLEGKLSLGNQEAAKQQSSKFAFYRNTDGENDNCCRFGDSGHQRIFNEGKGESELADREDSYEEVFDIVNCGPRRQFVVLGDEPTIVHNCEKSRGEGMSWIGILLAMHDWLFDDMAAIGFVSKDEVSADDPNDPDSLMWKCDYTLKKLPKWMAGERDKDWKRDVSKHVLRNLRNESTISAYAATGNVASGGRKKWFLKDELAKFPKPADKEAMASTQHVTNCRLIVSTPKGSDGAYYDVMHEPSNMVRVILDWKMNPTRNRGLYRFDNGIPVAVDPVNNPLPPHYDPPSEDVLDMFSRMRRKGFKLEGKQRSPWYDRECDRAGATPQNIAQELDRDYGGSAYRIMGDAFISKVEGTARDCVLEGDCDFDLEKLDHFKFIQTLGGPMRLWIPTDVNGNPPRSQYIVGGDVAAGTGGSYSSNSTLWGLDLLTGEQVLEYASNTIAPGDFADLAIALSKWLGGAYLAWEANGPGTSFTKQVISRRYENVFMRKSVSRFGRAGSKELGWWTDERSKEVMFDDMRKSVVMNEIVIRSRETLQEFGKYVRKDGKIQHALVKNAVDDSKGASHGDRAIAACVCLQAVKDRPLGDKAYDDIREIPEGTMAWRLKQLEESIAHQENDVWDHGIFARPF